MNEMTDNAGLESSVTQWLNRLGTGDRAAAEQLWGRYFQQMVRLARARLEGRRNAIADEEDVALSAFRSFCAGVEGGRYPRLTDRDGLWSLLVAITANKSVDLVRRESRRKRGGTARSAGVDLDGIIGCEPTPEFAAQMAEECARLLRSLDDETLRSVALWRMEGWSVEEIADRLNCVPRTIKRKLRRIRSVWLGGAATDQDETDDV